MLRLFLTLLVALLTTAPLSAQLDSLVFDAGTHALTPETRGELRINVEGMTFFSDSELKTPLMKGYTLPGAWLQPTVSYQPLRNLRLEAGAYMLHFWGSDSYPATYYDGLVDTQGSGRSQRVFHAVPVVRAQLQLSPTVTMTFGTLYGKASHGLVEPLYNKELNYIGDPEAGLQVRWETRPVSLDAWVDWQSFIYHGDDTQEAFTFGLSTRLRPSRRTAGVQWSLPIQVLFHHQGGEINTEAPDRQVKTWLNAAAGAQIDVPLRATFPARLTFEAFATYYSQQAGTALPLQSGYGTYARTWAQLAHFGLALAWWRAHQFIPIMGSPLYGTRSTSQTGLTYDDPQMVNFHGEYACPLGKGFAWGVEADVYQHLSATERDAATGLTRRTGGGTSFTAGAFLRICPSFLIKRF